MFDAGDSFSARLAAAQATLSPKMARLATFVSEHYFEAAFMTVRELAEATGVSVATVVRFPSALGYANFEALRTAIQDRVHFDLTGVEYFQSLPSTQRSPVALMRRIIDDDIESLRSLAHGFSEPQVDRFIGAILAAERVTILGFRYIHPLASYFGYSLGKILPNVQDFTQADSVLYDRVRLMTGGDLLIVLAYARYSSDLVAIAQYAHQHGVRILAITDTPLSPVLPFAEVALFARGSRLDFVGSLAAPAALINCVVSEIGVRLGATALERLQGLEEAASDNGTYVRSGRRSTPRTNLIAWQDDEADQETTPRDVAG